MNRTKLFGLALLAALALGALTGASASASAPEFGRCLKKAAKSLTPGSYDNAKCVKEASEDAGTEAEKLKKGNWEWIPGALAGHNAFTISGGAVTLQTVAGKTITCESEKGEGEYDLDNAKRLTGIVLEMQGCHGSKCVASSNGHGPGELVFNELAGEVGFREASRGTTALKLEPGASAGGIFIEFECVGIEVDMRGKGGAEGEGILVPIRNDAMISANTLKFKAGTSMAAKGVQKPVMWEGTPAETYMEMNFQHLGWEQAGWTSETTLTNDEAFKYELNRVL